MLIDSNEKNAHLARTRLHSILLADDAGQLLGVPTAKQPNHPADGSTREQRERQSSAEEVLGRVDPVAVSPASILQAFGLVGERAHLIKYSQ